LTLEDASNGLRILPAYLSDNYVSLLPGESRTIQVQYQTDGTNKIPKLEMRGWNITPSVVSISQAH
jgi:hypothetical protein